MSKVNFLFDGDFTDASPTGPLTQSRDNDTFAILFSQRYIQRASFWKPLPIGSAGPNGSFLTDETTPSPLGVAGLVEWRRNYAQKPPTRTIPQDDTHNYQLIQGGKVVSIGLPVVAYVTNTYYHTPNPLTIHLQLAYTLIQVGDSIIANGSPPGVGALMLGSDETLQLWRGYWWRKVTKMVPNKVYA